MKKICQCILLQVMLGQVIGCSSVGAVQKRLVLVQEQASIARIALSKALPLVEGTEAEEYVKKADKAVGSIQKDVGKAVNAMSGVQDKELWWEKLGGFISKILLLVLILVVLGIGITVISFARSKMAKVGIMLAKTQVGILPLKEVISASRSLSKPLEKAYKKQKRLKK